MIRASEDQDRRLYPLLEQWWERYVLNNFKGIAIFLVLAAIIAVHCFFVERKFPYLNFYFIPVLLAGYFLSQWSAIAAGLISIGTAGYLAFLRPDAFYLQHDPRALFFRLVSWGVLLLVCGIVVGRLRDKINRLNKSVKDFIQSQEELLMTTKHLDDQNVALGAIKSKVESVLYSSMDPQVAKMIVNNQLHNEKREITVLFSDVVNFTSSAEKMMPELVVSEMNRLFSHLEPIVSSYHGHLDKYMGDGMMVEFGTPRFMHQNALQAVLAGLKMQERLAENDLHWKMRVGIAHGVALVGLVGSTHRKNYTAMGHVVNMASRLQAKCQPGGVLIDEATHDRVRSWFRIRRLSHASDPEARRQEERLREIERQLMTEPPDSARCLEAAKICTELSFLSEAMRYYRKAVELDPARGDQVERAVSAALLQQKEAESVSGAGKVVPIAMFEVLALKDPLDHPVRIPPKIAAYSEPRLKLEGLRKDLLLPIEALNGTIGHSVSTAVLSCALTDALGLDGDAQRHAFIAGFFHDIGNRNVPPHLLNQSEQLMVSLPEHELSLMHSHVQEAKNVLEEMKIRLPAASMEAILQHHECFDGAGYPQGLRGDQISLIARIVKVADEYDALTTTGPFRDAWDPSGALWEMERQTGQGALDPKVFSAFAHMMLTSQPGPPPAAG